MDPLRTYLFLALLSPLCAFAQIKISNTSLQQPDSNHLYIGVDNRILISGVNNMAGTRLLYQGNYVALTKDSTADLKATAPGKTVIKLYRGKTLLHSKQFVIKRVNEPEASLNNFKNTALTKEEIIKNDSVIVTIPGCLLRFPVTITRFDMTIVAKNAALNISNSQMQGDHISPAAMDIIKQLESGDKILFDNMKAVGPDDAWVGSFFITIK